MADIQKLLQIKKIMKKKKPKFIRDGYGKRKRIDDKWRFPNARHNKLRHGFSGHRKKVMPGFRTNRFVRGLTLSGLRPIVVHNMRDISLLDRKINGAIIGKTVGARKKIILLEELKKQGISVLNFKEDYKDSLQEAFKQRKLLKEEREKKKQQREQKKEKKEVKKEELTAEEKEAAEKKEKDKILTKEQK